ncbi:hypothetical protein [Mesorhizobium sp. dw_380]|uniref:hypothetical protein n=1 Tax=Mesorhizobium sp. dw_380 TaxID=2812001 RepID=UPI001BDF63AB|nr:hypothetical protein [Mesorhizobium sp. dw_380]
MTEFEIATATTADRRSRARSRSGMDCARTPLKSSQRREKQRAIDLFGKRSLQISFRQQKLSTKRFQSGHLGGALSLGERHPGPTIFAKSQPTHPSALTKYSSGDTDSAKGSRALSIIQNWY